ncbi:MAG TPA: hypothetical protein VL360_03095 [Gammaproteobacteria bacterium]|jgi:hypothetical protein|nr:hypothetical protein [Gammaproteobacteria bacterium]
MFERLQKPFLTVETGEAYQPIRLSYEIKDADKTAAAINNLKCCESSASSSWNWFWRGECNDLHFESIDAFKKKPDSDVRLATLTLRNNVLYINLPSFKRACLAVPFFHRVINPEYAHILTADFINKVFGLDERLPHGFTELFKDDELDEIVRQRISDYEKVQERCENAATPEEALVILSEYTKKESQKRLPYAERYDFEHAKSDSQDPDVMFLGFYIFLRGRELVAIRRWFGNSGYTLADAADETMEQVFGGMDIDIIE